MSKQTTIRKKLTRSRVRKKISGSAARPRLSVRISNINVTAQLIDDTTGKTLAYVSTIGNKSVAIKNMTDKSKWAGEEIAKSAKAAKISTVVFDRGFRIYHGRVKQLAESARAGGLEF